MNKAMVWYYKNRDKALATMAQYRVTNSEAIAENKARWYQENKERLKEKRIMRLFGLSQLELNDLLQSQDRRCAICGSEVELVIDHNHETGEVRGLLCSLCNAGIGCLNDNPELLKKAVRYLGG